MSGFVFISPTVETTTGRKMAAHRHESVGGLTAGKRQMWGTQAWQ